MNERKTVAVLISGSGSNMCALGNATKAPDYPAQISLVLSDRPDAGGLGKAKAFGINAQAIARADYDSKQAHETAMLAALDKAQPDYICLAGYMRLISADFIAKWAGKIINIHPSILPLFPGLHTHQRAIDAGMRIHGASVHFVTEGMDEGPLIAQAAIPVLHNDTSDTLATRVLTIEHQIYPKALALLASGKVHMNSDRRAVFTDIHDDGGGTLLN